MRSRFRSLGCSEGPLGCGATGPSAPGPQLRVVSAVAGVELTSPTWWEPGGSWVGVGELGGRLLGVCLRCSQGRSGPGGGLQGRAGVRSRWGSEGDLRTWLLEKPGQVLIFGASQGLAGQRGAVRMEREIGPPWQHPALSTCAVPPLHRASPAYPARSLKTWP